MFYELGAGVYTVVVQDVNGCEWQTDVTIENGPTIGLDIGLDLDLKIGDTIQLESIFIPGSLQIDSIVWSPAEILSCTRCLNPVLTALTNARITATIYTGMGCEAMDELNLFVDKDFNIYVPNVFTPNGDDINDIVTVYAGDQVRRIVEFEIFDRWGEKVFSNHDFDPNEVDEGWDGRFRDQMMRRWTSQFCLAHMTHCVD